MQTPDTPKPGQRGFQPGCGCCVGPESDRCCCHIHQDAPRGLMPRKCSIHDLRDEAPPEPDDRAGCDPLYGERMDSADMGEN